MELALFDLDNTLLSGDSDFERALELVRTKGKRIAVVAHPDMTARELRNVAGRNAVVQVAFRFVTLISRDKRRPHCAVVLNDRPTDERCRAG